MQAVYTLPRVHETGKSRAADSATCVEVTQLLQTSAASCCIRPTHARIRTTEAMAHYYVYNILLMYS
jgi:hypothetical protein